MNFILHITSTVGWIFLYEIHLPRYPLSKSKCRKFKDMSYSGEQKWKERIFGF